MADDKEKKEKQAEQQEEKPTDGNKKASSGGLMTWLILGAVVLTGATGGFALAQLLGGSKPEPEAQTANQTPEAPKSPGQQSFEDLIAAENKDGKPWTYELEPVVANLDEPGVTRYARVAITLELSPGMDTINGGVFLEEKKLILRDWLTTYVAGLSLERVRGTRNLGRIKKEVRDHFNELLFPESKPFVQNILFKEFAIQ